MTDAPSTTEGEEPTDETTEDELDPRVSTPEDGFPLFDDEDSEEVQAQLDTDPDAYDEGAADLEGEH
jgi:hypothetical protein